MKCITFMCFMIVISIALPVDAETPSSAPAETTLAVNTAGQLDHSKDWLTPIRAGLRPLPQGRDDFLSVGSGPSPMPRKKTPGATVKPMACATCVWNATCNGFGKCRSEGAGFSCPQIDGIGGCECNTGVC